MSKNDPKNTVFHKYDVEASIDEIENAETHSTFKYGFTILSNPKNVRLSIEGMTKIMGDPKERDGILAKDENDVPKILSVIYQELFPTFFLLSKSLNVSCPPLRTHTSPGQIHVMRERAPHPIRVVLPGMCYRYDQVSARAEVQFNQVEGVAVGRHITMADLKGTLGAFARQMYGASVATRFRAAHFPVTEPSAEMDVECFVCGGTGCTASDSQAVIRAFQAEIARRGLGDEVRLVPTGCRGFCSMGPVVIVDPEGILYCQVQAGDVPLLVEETLVAKNAALLATAILAARHPPLKDALRAFRERQTAEVLARPDPAGG